MSFTVDAIRRLTSLTKDYFSRLSINNVPPGVSPPGVPAPSPMVLNSFWGKVTAASAVSGNNHQGLYTVVEQQRTATGTATPWQDMPNGRTVTAVCATEGYNGSGAVLLGNGIDHSAAGYPSTDWFQLVRGNPVVRIYGEYASDGSYVYTFEYVNSEDGAC